jgi:hypothetical protein
MSHKSKADLVSDNEALQQSMAMQVQLLTLYKSCKRLRAAVDMTYLYARDFNAFCNPEMVSGLHPLDPPHYHSPPPNCPMLTAFFLQSDILMNAKNSVNQLQLFRGVLSPRPPDTSHPHAVATPGHPQPSPFMHKDKGKG